MSEDSGSILLVGIGDIDRGDEVEWHSAMVNTVLFFAEERVLERVGMGDMNPRPWFELVVLKGGEDGRVAVDECPETGRGHDKDESLS